MEEMIKSGSEIPGSVCRKTELNSGVNMQQYEINSDHPCFDQIAMFVVYWSGHVSAIDLVMTVKKIVKFKNKISNEITVELHTGCMDINATGWPGNTSIKELGEWVKYLGGLGSTRPEKVVFETDFEKNNMKTNSASTYSSSMSEATFIPLQLTCQAIGMAYETNKGLIIQKFGEYQSNPDHNWPVELQFFRHARNAVFHDNKFNIHPYKGESQIDPSNPPQWRRFTILDDTVNGSSFANKFFPYHMVLPFLGDMGNLILEKGNHLST